jgi:hypothetical protein
LKSLPKLRIQEREYEGRKKERLKGEEKENKKEKVPKEIWWKGLLRHSL